MQALGLQRRAGHSEVDERYSRAHVRWEFHCWVSVIVYVNVVINIIAKATYIVVLVIVVVFAGQNHKKI